MTNDENAVQIDLAIQRMSRRGIPGAELFGVFQMNNRPGSFAPKLNPVTSAAPI
jgi:hypothetical protein